MTGAVFVVFYPNKLSEHPAVNITPCKRSPSRRFAGCSLFSGRITLAPESAGPLPGDFQSGTVGRRVRAGERSQGRSLTSYGRAVDATSDGLAPKRDRERCRAQRRSADDKAGRVFAPLLRTSPKRDEEDGLRQKGEEALLRWETELLQIVSEKEDLAPRREG